MFSRTTKDPAAIETNVPRKPAVASLVAEGVLLRGDLTTPGSLHLDGCVEGDIAAGQLTIGPTGAVMGAVRADSVEILGRVQGTVSARQVRLRATARVDGDISQAELTVEAGAHFEGRSLSFAPETIQEPLSVAAE